MDVGTLAVAVEDHDDFGGLHAFELAGSRATRRSLSYAEPMDLPDAVKDLVVRTVNVVHRALLTVSGGRIGSTLSNMPVYRVTTTGRTSGRPRTVMLTAPVRQGHTVVFVASKGGDDRDPDWYRNMVVNPEFTVETAEGAEPMTLVARTASAEEKAELWPQIVAAYKGYGGYQRKTERDIPVVVAEPVA